MLGLETGETGEADGQEGDGGEEGATKSVFEMMDHGVQGDYGRKSCQKG